MHKHQLLVKEFHLKFGHTVNDVPTLSPKDDALRIDLILEEGWKELREALSDGDRVKIADACADTRFVAFGSGVTYGLELEQEPFALEMDLTPTAFTILALVGRLGVEMEWGSLIDIREYLDGILCVINEVARVYSIPLDECFEEVHRSNMSKLWTDEEIIDRSKGTQTREIGEYSVLWVDGASAQRVGDEGRCWQVKSAGGKSLKSPSYSPANLADILTRQEVGA